jgi:hypothetical protein
VIVRSETWKNWSVLLALCGGCLATPLPTPPSVDASRVHLFEDQSYTRMRADEGAVDGLASVAVRITTTTGSVEVRPSARGAFTAFVPGPATSTFYLEALLMREDRFLGAITRGPMGTLAVDADPGPDADADGSPDAIDCAPMDPTLGGRRCPATCGEERCNMRDDDCDGLLDEGCGGTTCGSDAECALGLECAMGVCTAVACSPMIGCPAGTVCVSGFCEPRGGDADGDGYATPADCNDADDRVHPGAAEVCNMTDDDCNAMTDDGCMTGACMTDMECAASEVCTMAACVPRGCMADSDCPMPARCSGGICLPAMSDGDMDGYAVPADCDDANPAVNPGVAEACNMIDDDCDGTLDEGCAMSMCAADSDCPLTFECVMALCRRITCAMGTGCPMGSSCVFSECRPDGTDGDMDGVASPVDCDDTDDLIFPGAPERCNMLDDDCDALIDDMCM